MINKDFIYKIFEGFSIQRWTDLIRPFDLVEMDKAGEKMVLAYIIGKCEEQKGQYVDWTWLIYASLFDLLRKVSLCDIKAPIQDMLKKEYPGEYMHLSEWVLNQYKDIMEDEELFKQFTIYMGEKSGTIEIRGDRRLAFRILKAAHKFSTLRELNMLMAVNEKERVEGIQKDLEKDLQPYLDLEGVQKLLTRQKSFDFLMKIEMLRFQERWNQSPRIPKTTVLGHCFFVAICTLLLCRKVSRTTPMCKERIVNNYFSGLFHDLPEAVTRDIISPVKQATSSLPDIVKKIEDEIVNRELVPLMEDCFAEELMYYISDEFSNRILHEDGSCSHVSFEELNNLYNSKEYMPTDGALVRVCDHLSAFLEADISIKHGITSSHLVSGRDGLLESYTKRESINGVDVAYLFRSFM